MTPTRVIHLPTSPLIKAKQIYQIIIITYSRYTNNNRSSTENIFTVRFQTASSETSGICTEPGVTSAYWSSSLYDPVSANNCNTKSEYVN
ncbi:hypothetical protein HanPSC8_Chr16g0701711 [Helianthus annuus]|nr:hypothetical protein HanPSC8_Chr16g0701711 [Helianthus annuus]